MLLPNQETNKFHGSVYGFGNNQNLIGNHYPYSDGTGYAPKYQKQQEYQWGITFGGPIIKDKLFFFVNYEDANKKIPKYKWLRTNRFSSS